MAITEKVYSKAYTDVARMFASDRVAARHARDYGFGIMRAMVDRLYDEHVPGCTDTTCEECRIIAMMRTVKGQIDAIVRSGL